MTICAITGYACRCQPDEGIPCTGLEDLRKGHQEWRAKAEQLRGELTLADQICVTRNVAIASLGEENEKLRKQLEEIRQERLTWAMGCECACNACERLSSVIAKTGRSKPTGEPHGS